MSTTVDRSLPLDQQVESLVTPMASELGLVVYDVEVYPSSKRGRVRVTLDRDGGTEPGKGVTIDEITSVSRELGYVLEAEDVIRFEYHLEVTSPGIERDLKTERHWVQNIGAQVRAVLSAPVGGATVLEGELSAVEDGHAVVRVGEDDVRVSIEEVRRARTVYDFGDAAGAKGGPKQNSSKRAR